MPPAALPPSPQPLVAGGSAPDPKTAPPHCQFLATHLGEYKAKFSKDLLNKVQTIHRPLFDYSRLKNEVYVLYRSNDFVRKHARELITFIKSVNLQPGFSEVYKLQQLICTIPSNTASAERNFPL